MVEILVKRKTGYNSPYPKSGVPCSAETFAQAGSSVLRMNFSGKNPALRVATIRYRQACPPKSNRQK